MLPNPHAPPQMPHNGCNFTADQEEESIIRCLGAEAMLQRQNISPRGERTPRGRVSDDQGAKSPDGNDAVHVPFTHTVTQSLGAGKPMDLWHFRGVHNYIHLCSHINQSITEMTCTSSIYVYKNDVGVL